MQFLDENESGLWSYCFGALTQADLESVRRLNKHITLLDPIPKSTPLPYTFVEI
jgi:hypothetical protein